MRCENPHRKAEIAVIVPPRQWTHDGYDYHHHAEIHEDDEIRHGGQS